MRFLWPLLFTLSFQLHAQSRIDCSELQDYLKFYQNNQDTFQKLITDQDLSAQEILRLEHFYRAHYFQKDAEIILENLDSIGLSQGRVTFFEQEASAWWLLNEELGEKKPKHQIYKFKSAFMSDSFWKGSLENSIQELRNQLATCALNCESSTSHQSPIIQLEKSTKLISQSLLRTELLRYRHQLELKAMPETKIVQTFPTKQSNITGTPFHQIEQSQNSLNDLSNSGTVRKYFDQYGPSPFVLIDKSKQRLFLFDQHQLVFSQALNIDLLDDLSHGSAGIFQLKTFSYPKLELIDQRGRKQNITLAPEWVHCSKGDSCAEGSGTTPESVSSMMKSGITPVSVIPSNEELEFVVKNGVLTFTTYKKGMNYSQFNFSPRNTQSKPIHCQITKKEFDTEVAREFLATLETEKEKLMKLYKLDNDDYNRLVELSFAILGQESRFGTHWRYHLKERIPVGVAYMKRYKSILKKSWSELKENGVLDGLKEFVTDRLVLDAQFLTGNINTASNSRGPTQIKKVPELIAKEYGVTKESLQKPKHAAVATMGFLAEALVELKAKEKFHPNINGRNRHQYLHYIFMGKSYEIVKGTATPELNIYYRNLQEFMKGLEIYQE